MNDTSALLLLNGVPHRLSAVLANARLAPMISVKIEDIHALPHCGGPADSLIEHRPETPEATEREIVFFKQNGGFTILLGRKKFEESVKPVDEATAKKLRARPGEVRGRLLSTPALKKCRLENEPQPEPMEPIRTLDRGARTYSRDDSYQGNRMNFAADIRAPRRPLGEGPNDINKRFSR